MYIFMINLLPFVENRQINISLAFTQIKGLPLWYLERMLKFSEVFIIKGQSTQKAPINVIEKRPILLYLAFMQHFLSEL